MTSSSELPVAIAMSGGVDSSVAVLLTQKTKRPVMGITMVLHGQHHVAARNAKKISHQLGIEHHIIDLSHDFQEQVLIPYMEEYRSGRTPNPCILCNARIKFGILFHKARELGAKVLATGHYACLGVSACGSHLTFYRPSRGIPDETYFLYAIPSEIRSHLLFPLGGKSKEEVRALAKDATLRCHDQPSSQDTCFPDHIWREHCTRQWSVFDETGRYLGKTPPLSRVTLGQRRGLGLSLGDKRYVVRVDSLQGTLIMSSREGVYAKRLTACDMVWSSGNPPARTFQIEAKARYNQELSGAVVFAKSAKHAEIIFNEPQRSIAPGQSVVLYQGRELVGGGIIEKVLD